MTSTKTSRPLVYLAAPLFSEAELVFNLRLTRLLEEHADVYLPQRDGGKLVDLVGRGVEPRAASESIFRRDVDAIKEADILFIVMDGRSIDEGAAFELGYAYALGKRCIGLQTDPRRLMPVGNNPMIQVPLESVLRSSEEVVLWARSLARPLDVDTTLNEQVSPSR